MKEKEDKLLIIIKFIQLAHLSILLQAKKKEKSNPLSHFSQLKKVGYRLALRLIKYVLTKVSES